MKTITRTIAAATLSAGCLFGLSALPADARPTKAECDFINKNIEVCHKPVGRTNIELLVFNHTTNTGMHATRNCQTGDVWWNNQLEGLNAANYSQQDVFKMTRVTCNY